jgi:hypothetical protein
VGIKGRFPKHLHNPRDWNATSPTAPDHSKETQLDGMARELAADRHPAQNRGSLYRLLLLPAFQEQEGLDRGVRRREPILSHVFKYLG